MSRSCYECNKYHYCGVRMFLLNKIVTECKMFFEISFHTKLHEFIGNHCLEFDSKPNQED